MLLQAAYSDDQIGAFENFHQLLEDALIVLRPGPKVFFQDELRVVDRLKSQLLIGHLCLPICMLPRQIGGLEIKPLWGNASVFLSHSINFYFNGEAIGARSRRLTAFLTPTCRYAGGSPEFTIGCFAGLHPGAMQRSRSHRA